MVPCSLDTTVNSSAQLPSHVLAGNTGDRLRPLLLFFDQPPMVLPSGRPPSTWKFCFVIVVLINHMWALRSSRASSPQGRTEPVEVLGGPQCPDAFETLKVHRHSHLVQICHLRVAFRRPCILPCENQGQAALKAAQNLAPSAQRPLKPG